MSYYDEAKTKIYAACVMETPSAESREGWKVKGDAKEALKTDIRERFGKSPQPLIDEVLDKMEEWYLYPVYKLPPKGKWWKERCLLIGDAAHAMPPQGESIGLAVEDVILLSRVMSKYPYKTHEELFELYEKLRRERIESAFAKAEWMWETVKDKGWFGGFMMEQFTGLFLNWTKKAKEDELAYDVRNIDLSE